jgi:hypothetical protein
VLKVILCPPKKHRISAKMIGIGVPAVLVSPIYLNRPVHPSLSKCFLVLLTLDEREPIYVEKEISSGVVNEVPADSKKALTSDPHAFTAWEDITPLTRNEWICWIESAQKQKLEAAHRVGLFSLRGGKRCPCCWPGCAHR